MSPAAGLAPPEAARCGLADSQVGTVLVIESPDGLCRVALAEHRRGYDRRTDEGVSVDRLEASPAVDATARLIADSIDGDHDATTRLHTLAWDLTASPFQRRVWQALQTIPRGETRSYAAVAAALGSPRGARAVAGACARNPLAIVVPCHRVIASRGGLTGYRWGLERKARLLEIERTV